MDVKKIKTDIVARRRRNRPSSFGLIKKTAPNAWNGFLIASKIKTTTSSNAVQIAKTLILDPYKEHFIAIYLDSCGRKIKTELISLGTLTAGIIHPRELFRPAIIHSAATIIVLHNHPSGNTTPSKNDIEVTSRLVKVGELLGIELTDHIIFTAGKKYYSFREQNVIQ